MSVLIGGECILRLGPHTVGRFFFFHTAGRPQLDFRVVLLYLCK